MIWKIQLSERFPTAIPGRAHARPSDHVVRLWCSVLLLLSSIAAQAGSATWKVDPGSSDWDTAINWTPATVPYGETDIATFGVSNTTNITVGEAPNGEDAANIMGEILFQPGASAYTITAIPVSDVILPTTLEFFGRGISNDSGVVQNFVAANSSGTHAASRIAFHNSASLGENTIITHEGGADSIPDGLYGAFTWFLDTATVANTTLINNGGTVRGSYGGSCILWDFATADNATFINNPGEVAGAGGGFTEMLGFGSVGSSTFIANGPTVSGAQGGLLAIYSGEAAGARFILNGATVPNAAGAQIYVYGGSGYATFTGNGGQGAGALGGVIDLFDLPGSSQTVVIANAGTNGGSGARILIENDASPSKGQFRVFGNGLLDLTKAKPPGPTIGSLEGDGLVSLVTSALSIGGNNLSTTFSGTIQDAGSIAKVGTGTLTLSNANLYTGGTTVTQGTLVASNLSGSGTGTGPVLTNAGTLGGSGIISGAVTVGTGSGAGAFLAPAHGGKKQLTLTIQSSLTFNSDSTYTYTFKAKNNRSKTDKVVANGVTIKNGASINLSGTTQGALTQGTALTLIKNTAATPIVGTFNNLPDDAIVNVNGNNFQADYQGGDDNDLTLTVVP
ncbi:MAG: autotransporter-associated beta strand repeat-containing protein [Chthoniobacterales bacterium]|nr:autotransporter-associated beta strand repeat-containing protein [Chthoniobacterales bacterium]